MQRQANSVVLVVEDDALIRMTAAEIFLNADYDVGEAGNTDEAIEIPEKRLDIQIVFTDIEMPKSMDGLRLAAVIRGALAADRDLRCILMVSCDEASNAGRQSVLV